MTELAPNGDQGGGQAETWFRPEYVDVCIEEDGAFEFSLGSITTQTETYEEEVAVWDRRIEAVLVSVGVDPDNWTQQVEVLRRMHHEDISGRRLHARGENPPIGKFIRKVVFWDMPMGSIGSEEEGDGGAALVLRVPNNRLLEIGCKASYGRDRFYTDADEAPTELLEGAARLDRVSDPDDPKYLGFEDWFRMSFRGTIRPASMED